MIMHFLTTRLLIWVWRMKTTVIPSCIGRVREKEALHNVLYVGGGQTKNMNHTELGDKENWRGYWTKQH